MIFGKAWGALPRGARKARIQASPHYREGAFQNLSRTEVMAPGTSYVKLLRETFASRKMVRPPHRLPMQRHSLQQLPSGAPTVVWLGHSSYLISYKGRRLLVDPVLAGRASPLSFGNIGLPFDGTDVYSHSDIGAVDVLLLTHDHYDHLHYASVRALAPQAAHTVAPLGVGAHLEYWGLPATAFTELDWYEAKSLPDMHITALPARHFSGRGLVRNQSLWASYMVQWDGLKLFIGGDSGYDTHFAHIGAQHGPFDLAILEIGQYNERWPFIHSTPEQAVQAALDLRARCMLPVHWGKFALALHSWDEPIERVLLAAQQQRMPLLLPQLGAPTPILPLPDNQSLWWRERPTGS